MAPGTGEAPEFPLAKRRVGAVGVEGLDTSGGGPSLSSDSLGLPGSAAGLDGSIAKAYENKEPWLGYYWAPTAILGKYPMGLPIMYL